MKRKPERHRSLGFPRQDEAHAPHIPTDDPSHKELPRQALTKAEKKKLRERDRNLLKDDWLAPAGSEQEKQILRKWAEQKGLSKEERAIIHEAINCRDESARRNLLFWQVAKHRVLGDFVYDRAIERHGKLNSREWLVAYFTTQGLKQGKIADLTYMSERMVDETILSLKDKIAQDLDCDTVHIAQITRWFLGV